MRTPSLIPNFELLLTYHITSFLLLHWRVFCEKLHRRGGMLSLSLSPLFFSSLLLPLSFALSSFSERERKWELAPLLTIEMIQDSLLILHEPELLLYHSILFFSTALYSSSLFSLSVVVSSLCDVLSLFSFSPAGRTSLRTQIYKVTARHTHTHTQTATTTRVYSSGVFERRNLVPLYLVISHTNRLTGLSIALNEAGVTRELTHKVPKRTEGALSISLLLFFVPSKPIHNA